ncbi:hypothetical protein HMPREF1986_00034 [Oribacterium sp. oral taxon 078 str. F0263]|nr:hypothetical protein HMPREF1986_00034 [Oribacterium sp. oral taxon 078 str. F0263]
MLPAPPSPGSIVCAGLRILGKRGILRLFPVFPLNPSVEGGLSIARALGDPLFHARFSPWLWQSERRPRWTEEPGRCDNTTGI